MKKLVIYALFTLIPLVAAAQSSGELLRFSQYDFYNSTARSAAMGGAFTSLGADLSSMSINPAGLAMYSTSEFSVSAGLNISPTFSSYGGQNSNMKSHVKFVLPAMGVNIKLGDFSLAFGWNRLADFNSVMSIDGNYEKFNSIGRMWADQLNGTYQSELSNEHTMFNRNRNMWNAVMGFDSFMIDPNQPNNPYNTEYGLWHIINPGDYIASSMDISTSGAVDEWTLSGAYNFDDILYIGATMGFQRNHYVQSSTYTEMNDLDNPQLSGVFNSMYLREQLTMDGFGFNLKVGATVRPVSWLRIGVAYHSPTWITMREVSNADMEPFLEDNTGLYSFTPDQVQDYYMQTPSRLMAGVSATIARRLIISFDYELTWYGSMLYTTPINSSGWRPNVLPNDIDNFPTYSDNTSANGDIDINNVIVNSYRSTNNYRLGIEVNAVAGLFVRAGFGYSESPYAAKESFYEPGKLMSDYGAITRWSGGLGYGAGMFRIDASYVYSGWSELPSAFFDYVTTNSYNPGGGSDIISAGSRLISDQNIERKREKHNVTLTFSWRF